VSIIVDNGPFECEITEDGELIFLNYNITHDLAAMEFGYSETPALFELHRWNFNPVSMLLRLVSKTLSIAEAALIGRQWLDMVCDRVGVRDIHTESSKNVIKHIDDAVAAEDKENLDEIATFIGFSAAAYQQQEWRSGTYKNSLSPKELLTNASLGLTLASALSEYVMVARYTMAPQSFWEPHKMLGYGGGRAHAIRHLEDIPSPSIPNLALIDLAAKFDGPVSAEQIVDTKQKIGKEFAGAAVAIIAQQRGL